MSDHRVKNVYEAVMGASRMKAAGMFDWFRGQTSPWPVTSTLFRLPEDRFEQAKRRINAFWQWVNRTPALKQIADDPNAVLAIAQHYGLPTYLIDFTTSPEVAGFFATHGANLEEGQDCCIICINKSHFSEFCEKIKQEIQSSNLRVSAPEIISLSVDNLWRLEAQHGEFMHYQLAAVDELYNLTRIIFPYTGPVKKPTPDVIYPKRKSSLEILLDQYFTQEAILRNRAMLWEIADAQREDFITIEMDAPDIPKYFLEGAATPHHSWDRERLEPWLIPRAQKWNEAVTRENWVFKIDLDNDPRVTGQKFSLDLMDCLSSSRAARGKLINWGIELDDSPPLNVLKNELLRAIPRLWDGMRLLPYSDEDVAKSIGACVALAVSGWQEHLNSYKDEIALIERWLEKRGYRYANSHESADFRKRRAEKEFRDYKPNWERISKSFFSNSACLEFGPTTEEIAKGVASLDSIRQALRDDFEEILEPEYRQQFQDSIISLLLCDMPPKYIFDFDRLTKVFAYEIAPSEVLILGPVNAVYYSPVQLDIFGLD